MVDQDAGLGTCRAEVGPGRRSCRRDMALDEHAVCEIMVDQDPGLGTRRAEVGRDRRSCTRNMAPRTGQYDGAAPDTNERQGEGQEAARQEEQARQDDQEGEDCQEGGEEQQGPGRMFACLSSLAGLATAQPSRRDSVRLQAYPQSSRFLNT